MDPLRVSSRASSGRGLAQEVGPAHSEFRGGQVGQAYNEPAFRHFLEADRLRARRSRRLLYLVLVGVRQSPGRQARITSPAAVAIFRGLGASVREVDFVGWFRKDRVAAAVLAQGMKMPDDEVAPLIAARVLGELRGQVPAGLISHLRVRVVRLGGRSGR